MATVLGVAGILLAMNQAFSWNPGGLSLLRNSYLYYILACFLPIVFIVKPVWKGKGAARVPFYDVILAAVSAAVPVYFGLSGERIVTYGWERAAPDSATLLAIVFWVLVLEALRRTAGLIVTVLALAFSVYPLIAGDMPIEILRGIPYGLESAAQMHAFGTDSILGVPLVTAATILVGFLLFGVALQHAGGGAFFFDLAQSLFGRFRGGPAKVATISSALLGMMSGSAVSNVLTSGPLTIPAMRKAGFSAKYAAGVEATASTGGTITPPIMGTAAFLMVSFIGVPYAEIALAAIIPAILFFFGIFVQVDAYSAKTGLRGTPRDLLPRIGGVLLSGWPFVLALAGLVVYLAVVKNELRAPYWFVGVLLVVMVVRSLLAGNGRGVLGELYGFLYDSAKTVAEIVGIIAGVGLIVGGLTMTGVSLSLARELIAVVGDNLLLVLIAGAVTSFVLGMGMTVSAVYVFLAIVISPVFGSLGLNPVAAHLFIIYWATVSYITPPVGLASFAAANIAKSPPMATSVTAMRLGAVKYIIPFGFVLNPALVAQESTLLEILASVGVAALAVFFIGCAFEGWAIGVHRRMKLVVRWLLAAAGILTFSPDWTVSLIAIAAGIVLMASTRVWNSGGPADERRDSGSSGPVGASAGDEREQVRERENKEMRSGLQNGI